MQTQANRRIFAMEQLDSVAQIKADLPISVHLAHQVARQTQFVEDILTGKDHRLLVVDGPCSIHDPVAAIKLATHILQAQRKFGDKLLIIMRLFFAKPRTLITGPEHWTGLINDPLRDGSFQMNQGMRAARQMAIAITSMGVPIATEIMDFNQANLLDDLVSWVAIGARSVESQAMRQVGSALCTPVGFKNATSGDMDIAVNAILTARQPQTFTGPNQDGVLCKITSTGNPFAHLVLRGGIDGPNFDTEHITLAKQKLADAGIVTGIGIDCSHANSGKKARQQEVVAQNIAEQIAAGEGSIRMVMQEVNLIGGRQDHWDKSDEELTFGLSITDECADFGQGLRSMKVLADVAS